MPEIPAKRVVVIGQGAEAIIDLSNEIPPAPVR